jgi:UDP-glucose 4-epimerase
MKILVTGAAGFIGLHLVKALSKDGHEVITIDKEYSKTKELKHIKLDISTLDIFDYDFGKVDAIYHLAAQSGGYYSLVQPYLDGMWNCIGTLNIVKLAQQLKVKQFIYTSSMAVYGNLTNATEDSPLNPISFYGTSKLTGEFYTKLLAEHDNISYSIFRLFPTYGSGQDLENKHQGIVSIYLDQVLNKREVSITGNKTRVRELVHVSDVISALTLALNNKMFTNETFNVLYKEELTPEKMINKICERLDKKVPIKELDGYKGDQVHVTGSNSKLLKTGWKPEFDLEKGIDEFVSNLS